jgi:trigger factor
MRRLGSRDGPGRPDAALLGLRSPLLIFSFLLLLSPPPVPSLVSGVPAPAPVTFRSMAIEITPKESSSAERRLAVSVPVEQVRDAEDEAARGYASKVRLPGFRPGKAPPAMVRKRYADAIRQQALEALVREAYEEAIGREQLKLVGQPHVHDLKFEQGQPLTFELHLEVRPEVKLARTQGFRVERPARPVTQDQVTEQLDAMREQRASWTPVEGRPGPGDMVTVVLSTPDDTGALGEGKEHRLVLGSGQAIAGIEELIMEAQPGETVERPVKWPDDFPDETQRAKTKSVRVTLRDVKRRSLPPLDDAFAREVGDFDSKDALVAAVREDLTRHAEREADAEVRRRLLDDIAGANPFELPPTWVQRLIDAYARAYQIPEADRPRFATEFRPVAESQVRREVIIDTIAERESLGASEAEVDAHVTDIAAKRQAPVAEVYSSLQKADRLREIERSVTEDKVFKWLLERNTVEST